MKNILALAVVLLLLTSCEDGVLFTPKGKTYAMWWDEQQAITLTFNSNTKGNLKCWLNYAEKIPFKEENGNPFPSELDFTYTLKYPNITLNFNDSLICEYFFYSEDTLVNPSGYFFAGNLKSWKFVRID